MDVDETVLLVESGCFGDQGTWRETDFHLEAHPLSKDVTF